MDSVCSWASDANLRARKNGKNGGTESVGKVSGDETLSLLRLKIWGTGQKARPKVQHPIDCHLIVRCSWFF